MGFLFGTPKTNSRSVPAITGMPIQTSAYGKPIALIYGKARAGCNLIDYGKFQQTSGSRPSGGGKGGITGGGGKGASGSSSTTYSAVVALGFCEGPITGYGAFWQSQTQTTPAAVGLTTLTGTGSQADLAFLDALHPSAPLAYPFLAYAAANPYQLGTSAQLPNNNVEILGLLYGTAPNGVDADPSQVVADLLTNPRYGAGFPAARLGTLVTNNEGHTVPASGPFTITVTNAASFSFNLAVVDATGTYACVAANPGARQYAFNPATGVYTFSSANAGAAVTIRYANLAALTAYQNFALASGLWISPIYDAQAQASAMLDEIAKLTYSSWVWSSGVLTLVPRGTMAVTANGYTFTPALTPLFNLGADDFLPNSNATGTHSAGTNDDPVILTRRRPSDQINNIKLEFLDRANQYAPSIAEISDQALIDKFGRRANASQTAHLFCDTAAANTSAQLQMQDEHIRNRYSFALDARYSGLDPMDPVTLTEAALGLNLQLVRITEITENNDGTLSMVAEEVPTGSGVAAAYNLNAGQGYQPNYNAAPGHVNAPIILEAPVQIASNAGLEIWCALSGVTPALWGGCDVWVSSDGNTYKLVGRQIGAARMGVTTADFPVGSDPDTTDTLAVDLTESQGTLGSGTQADADLNHTLCAVAGANGIEYMSYETATLTASYKYNLATYLRRGQFQSPIVDHPSGSPFARLDAEIFHFPYDKSQIGSTIYLKFTSFNPWQGGEEALSAVTAYTHVIAGPPPPGTVAGFTAQQVGDAVVFIWVDLVDYALKGYDLLYWPQSGSSATAVLISQASRSTETTTAQIPPGAWTFGIRGHDIADQLGPLSTVNLTVSAGGRTVIASEPQAPSWPGLPGGASRGFFLHGTGVLCPLGTKLASSYANFAEFNTWCPDPVSQAVYEAAPVIDLGFADGGGRLYAAPLSYAPGPGAGGQPAVAMQEYSDAAVPPPAPLLDTVPYPTAAWGLRKLRTAYAGNAVNIRRSSDNTTQDIGFDTNGNFDAAGFHTFVAAGSGFVTKWYDQSGNGLDLAQSTAANQPQLVLCAMNGKPVVRADGTSSFLTIAFNSAFALTGDQTFHAVLQSSLGGLAQIVSHYDAGGAHGWSFEIGDPFGVTMAYFSDTGRVTTDTVTVSDGSPHLCQFTRTSGMGQFYTDGAAGTSATGLGNAATTAALDVFNTAATGGDYFGGDIPELIIWPRAISKSERATTQNSVAGYYETPETGGTPWLAWTSGALPPARYVRTRVVMTPAPNPGYLSAFTPTIDKPPNNQSSSGTITVAAGGTPISFNPPYHFLPALTLGAAAGNVAWYTALTITGFTLHVGPDTSHDNGGSASWQSTGA